MAYSKGREWEAPLLLPLRATPGSVAINGAADLKLNALRHML